MRDRPRTTTRWRRPALLAALLLAAGCSDSPTTPGAGGGPAVLESATPAATVPRGFIDARLREAGLQGRFQATYDAQMYRVRYRTTGVDGRPTVATGAVYVPAGAPGPLPLATYQHGTVTLKNDVPSNPLSFEGGSVGPLFASSGFVVAMPDYLGLGDGEGFHPYLHRATHASAALDMLRAARETAAANRVALDGKLFVFGYSQGGAAAMALHREIEERAAGEFTVTASAPLSGPYDLTGTARTLLETDPAYRPLVIYTAYLLSAFNRIYRFAARPDDIFVPQHAELADQVPLGLHPPATLEARLPASPRALLQPAFREALLADAGHPLWRALRENEVYDWRPRAPTRLFGAGGDRDVPFANALTAAARMQQLGADVRAVNLGDRLTHSSAVVPALIAAKEWFDGFR